jgi:preprotein translocase subunit SecE
MNAQVDNQAGALDIAKLVLAVLVIAGGITGFYLLPDLLLVFRWLIVLASLVLAGFIAMQSAFGHRFAQFVTLARGELRKVVWPTGKETWRTTLVVFVFVVVMGFFFWFLDVGLAWASKALTRPGGS